MSETEIETDTDTDTYTYTDTDADTDENNFNQILFEEFLDYMRNDLKLQNDNIDTGGLFTDIDDYQERIDEPITDKLTILVKDNRSSIYWDRWGWTKQDAQEFVNYTRVYGTLETPITLRMVFVAMSKDTHYSLDMVQLQAHNFLEFYTWKTPCVLEFYYSS